MGTDTNPIKHAILHMTHAKWHVFYVQTRHEKVAAKQLAEDGYQVYLPLKKTLKFYAKRKKWIEEPVFQSYLFIKILPSELHSILKHPKILSYIRFNNQAATIREQHIELIKQLLQKETAFEVEQKDYQSGEKIQFETGPFKGHQGLIIEKRSKRKLLVQLDELDYQIVIEL